MSINPRTLTSEKAPPEQRSDDPRLVPSVERAARLLEFLSLQEAPVSLAMLARTLALPKSSLHGLLSTLTTLGLVLRSETNNYSLGPRVLQWAGNYASHSALVDAFNHHAPAIQALIPETLMLAMLDGADVVYLACRQGRNPLAVNFRVGGRFPASCTSSGKAILATLPEHQVRALMNKAGLRPLTRFSVATVDDLMKQLHQVRQRAYAVDDQETAEGMFCFGAPVHAAGQTHAIAAVATSLIKATITPEQTLEMASAIHLLAAKMSARLGASAA